MGTAENSKTVLALFDAIESGSFDACAGLLTDDATWWVPQSAASMGVERPIRSREAVAHLLTGSELFQRGPMEHDQHHVIAEGDLAACHQTMRTLTAAGVPYENHYVFVFRFQDGRIAEVWEHLDTAYAYARLAETPSG